MSSHSGISNRKLVAHAFLTAAMLGLVGFVGYGHVDAEGTKQAVEDMGMTNVEIKGGAHYNCRAAFYKTAFTAVTEKGSKVEGIACRVLKSPDIKPEVRFHLNR